MEHWRCAQRHGEGHDGGEDSTGSGEAGGMGQEGSMKRGLELPRTFSDSMAQNEPCAKVQALHARQNCSNG